PTPRVTPGWGDKDMWWANPQWQLQCALGGFAAGGLATTAPRPQAEPQEPRRVQVPSPKVPKVQANGLLVRLAARVQEFDDKLSDGQGGANLRDFVLRALRPEVPATGRDTAAGGSQRRSEASPSPDPVKVADHPEKLSHLRNFLEVGTWNCCLLERYGAAETRELMQFSRHASWQRLRSAAVQEGVSARGWVCSHRGPSAVVRLVAVEVPVFEEEDRGAKQGESPLPLLPPPDGEGLLALLCREDGSECKAPAVGSALRVRFLSDTPMQRRTLREAGASCRVCMDARSAAVGMPIVRNSSLRALGTYGPEGSSQEWPEGGVSDVLRQDPCQSAAAAEARSACGPPAIRQAKDLGLVSLHGSLVDAPEAEGGPRHAPEPHPKPQLGGPPREGRHRQGAQRRSEGGAGEVRSGTGALPPAQGGPGGPWGSPCQPGPCTGGIEGLRCRAGS
ncbi:unnamed protein product, partial [Effrenium voratum]